jgi:2-dehydro-3-deoxyphosphogluconate aldolase / (4S)-4-hydroxy-2-oxoglutarate aldolase
MPSTRADFDRALDHAPAIAVVCAERADWGMHAASACVAAGFQLLAIGADTPEAVQIIASVAARPDMVVGMARARTAAHVTEAHAAGAGFVMAATTSTDVGAAARAVEMTWIAGALTPTEIAHAATAGADLVQVYPAGTAGGPVHIRLMADLFPEVPFVAGGGIGGDRMATYLSSGARAVALSEALYSRELMAAGEHMTIRNHAATAHLEATRHGGGGSR